MRTGTFQHTDATGIPALVTIEDGTRDHPRMGKVPCLNVSVRKCGMSFGVILTILEPDSPCPLIEVPRPMGADFVAAIIAHCSGQRALPGAQ